MAIPQSKNSNGKSQPSSSARFRQRKISVKQPLTIYRLKDLPTGDLANELEPSQVHHLSNNGQQRDLHSVETGVDKNEEDEVHLQQVINAAQKALLSTQKDEKEEETDKSKSVYIPTPDASKLWDEASKYYNDHGFKEPESYIKYSAQVEDAIGVDYNLDEEDQEFIDNTLSKNYPTKKTEAKCSETEYEIIISKYEKCIEEKQPFLSMDVTTILSYKELSAFIIEEFKSSNKNNPYVQVGANLKYLSSTALKERLSKELKFEPYVTLFDKNPLTQDKNNGPRSIIKLLDLFGEPIYEFWKKRKTARNGKSIVPSLKYEDPRANEKDNDNDPYICFRRREFRQARKTRRADSIGIEKIRLLQKSLHRARDIMFNVSQREILKLDVFRLEFEVFKLRSQAKAAKRSIGLAGDDHLFYPNKKKKVIKIKVEEDEDEREVKVRREKKYRDSRDINPLANIAKTNVDTTTSSTQPYVKLPPSKIPDLDLVTVSLVLKEKNETIRRAVLEKLRKRKELDKGYVNLTDDPYQPFFNISTNTKLLDRELKHVPYSSIAAANLHQMSTSNIVNSKLKEILQRGEKPLPGVKTFNGKNGELVPSEPFPHLKTLLNDHLESKRNSNGYIAHLLNNIETNTFNVYINGYGNSEVESTDDQLKISDPMFRLRRRVGRGNRAFVDRRILNNENKYSPVLEASEDDTDKTVYHSKVDAYKRLKSNWKFDDESSEYSMNLNEPFSLDPSRLNNISDETQSIRFGSMLLSKSYELLKESVAQRQQAYIQQVRMRAALQQQQMRNNPRNLQRLQQAAQSQQLQQASGTGTSSGSSSVANTQSN